MLATEKSTVSRLGRSISQNGRTVQVQIYRLVGHKGWTVELVDQKGERVMWSDMFLTDRFALDEVVRAIKADEITAFGAT